MNYFFLNNKMEEEKYFLCEINECNRPFKQKSDLKRHQRNVHRIGIIWYPCNINECPYSAKSSSDLTKHKTGFHKIGLVPFKCDIDNCNGEFTDSSGLNRHKRTVHLINTTWILCDVKSCEEKFKSNSELKQHKMRRHDVEVDLIYCDDEKCTKGFKTKGELKIHKIQAHNIAVKWFSCDINECKGTFKTKSNLTQHQANIHNINTKIFVCDFEDCKESYKTKERLKNHKSFKHDIDVTWFKCGINECNDKFKSNGSLKDHKMRKHNIGRYTCDICINNRNSTNSWEDKHNNKLNICHDCFKKATGKDSRKEIRMSDYLDTIEEIAPFLVGTDDSFKKLGGCSLKRPDKLYMSPDLVLWIECDEFQHTKSNSSYSCDEKRISDCYDEFDGKQLVVIRWNPDNYKPFDNNTKLTFQQRLKLLKTHIMDVLETPPEEPIYIYYMFYDEDNPLISENIPNELIN